MWSRGVPDQKKASMIVVFVSYYVTDAKAAIMLVDDFCDKIGKTYSEAIIVDNSGCIESFDPVERRHRVVGGDNSAWEFSGWLRGIEELRSTSASVIVFLNDSYGRNWSVSLLSRFYLRRMCRAASDDRVAAWMDNFSYFRQPRFSRRPNSRVVFVSASSLISFSESLRGAICSLRERLIKGVPLFTENEQKCLDRWTASQCGRWSTGTLVHRTQRIFIEHHMFQDLDVRSLQFFPRTWLGSIVYGAVRRLLKERR
jgi:hypothetical protein